MLKLSPDQVSLPEIVDKFFFKDLVQPIKLIAINFWGF